MSTNFENINLLFPEKVKLFCMRFKKHVSEKFLGSSARMLVGIHFVTATYPLCDITPAKTRPKVTYSLTDRYYRYCVYRRRKFFDSKVWPLVISVLASIITSIITTWLLQ